MLYSTRSLSFCLLLMLTSSCGADSSQSDGVSPGDMGSAEYCQAVTDWDGTWTTMEADVVTEMNKRRAAGADCRTEGTFPPAPPLAAHGLLQCAARNHSVDMHIRDYFAHESPDDFHVGDRANWAGYPWVVIGENLALGSPTAAGAVAGWMGSDGHCRNIMLAEFEEVGIGYYPGKNPLWTAVFGTR